MSSLSRRFRPNVIDRAVAKQGHRCALCDLPFGTIISNRTGKEETQYPVGDHLIPYEWLGLTSEFNCVALCQLCNKLKNDDVFDEIETMRRYIIGKRLSKKIHVVFLPRVAQTEDPVSWAKEWSEWLQNDD